MTFFHFCDIIFTMRISIHFKSEKEVSFPQNIRNFFISFIKKTFENSDPILYRTLFEDKKVKPYVFSPFFGEEFDKGKIGKNISFIFSSGDFEIISKFWNGLLSLKEKKLDFLEINGERFNLYDIKLLQDKKINNSEVLFKTIGISVLTNPEESAKNFKKWYIVPEKENIEKFNKVLRKRTEERFNYIKGENRKIEIEFILPSEIENPVAETIIPHYNGYLRGFRGKFILKGDIDILQFLYDFGFGVRTGQGFGLLEIVLSGKEI